MDMSSFSLVNLFEKKFAHNFHPRASAISYLQFLLSLGMSLTSSAEVVLVALTWTRVVCPGDTAGRKMLNNMIKLSIYGTCK